MSSEQPGSGAAGGNPDSGDLELGGEDDPLFNFAAAEPREQIEERADELPGVKTAADHPIHKQRFVVALALMGALALYAIIAVFAVALGREASEITDLTEGIFTPLVGLAGAVIGFYFGAVKS